jgi:S-formylglutathione hydrolase FrmB
MKQLIAVTLIIFSVSFLQAGTVDTLTIRSRAMQRDFKCVVIKPAAYLLKKNLRYPVVYLLHGHSGNYKSWITQAPELTYYADTYQLIIVCPDGDYNSWYIDSPVDSTQKFETYISKEVPEVIEKKYRTTANRKARAITGLSMGGHGGLSIGLKHADFFGACGSMSGGVDLRPFAKNWQLVYKLGDTIRQAANWKNYSVTHLIETYRGDSSKIIIDCGTEDFFYSVNKVLHEKMLRLKISHDYTERPGAHDWNYWKNAVKYQLLFFKSYFIAGK